ncbi:MAG: SDR family NAD(P)-dependent oxidoreductase [Hyphomicrobiaceae bacterium]
MITADLTGKRALVTGGASGIGLATTKALLRCGAQVAINHLPGDDKAKATLETLRKSSNTVIGAAGDVSDPASAENMVGQAIDDLGGLDILINNAGTSLTVEPIPFPDLDAMTEEFWTKILATNLVGPFRCTRAAAPALKASRGCIVSTASIAGLGIGGAGSSLAYSAAKAALINLTRNLARALGPEIRVNAVAPGLTRTPWTDPWPPERKARYAEAAPLRRFVEADDIAETMIFLCAQQAITGQTIVVDCGRTT